MPSKDSSTSKRALSFSAAAAGLVLLAAVVFTGWPLDPADHAPGSVRDEPDGETVGWVSKVEANTIHVNSGPFGSGIVPLVITRNTRITVGSKEGWFEDIRPGGQVKVVYDLFQGRRFARSVELLVDEGTRGVLRGEPRVKSAAGTVSVERVPTGPTSPADGRPATAGRSVEPAPATVPPGSHPMSEETQKTSTGSAPIASHEARPAVKPEVGSAQALDATRTRTPSLPARNGGAPPDGARAQSSPRPAATPPPSESGRTSDPGSGGTSDGSEAVEWLLKQRN